MIVSQHDKVIKVAHDAKRQDFWYATTGRNFVQGNTSCNYISSHFSSLLTSFLPLANVSLNRPLTKCVWPWVVYTITLCIDTYMQHASLLKKAHLDAETKIIIFGHHTSVLDKIEQDLESSPIKDLKYIRIDGTHNTKSEKRADLCQLFQTDDTCRVAILSITAVGVRKLPSNQTLSMSMTSKINV